MSNQEKSDDQPALYDCSDDTLGGRLIKAREAAGLTTAQLARRLGVKTKTMANWESDRSEPRANRLNMLAGILGVSTTWLLVGHGQGLADADFTGGKREIFDLLAELRARQRDVDRLVATIEAKLTRLPASELDAKDQVGIRLVE